LRKVIVFLFLRATSQAAMFAWIFGDCREGQILAALQHFKLDNPLLAAGSLIEKNILKIFKNYD